MRNLVLVSQFERLAGGGGWVSGQPETPLDTPLQVTFCNTNEFHMRVGLQRRQGNWCILFGFGL